MKKLASVKFRFVLPFWYWLTRVVPEKKAVKRVVCVFKICLDYNTTNPDKVHKPFIYLV